ncbi:hypothetical protein [Kineococcus sp. SYSU DK005]|uniref:hypothetical protein n=1 Tax=Kineococcus sp. SYSU DK005 TaxID=3383126 RepID=UPI003D7DF902
MRRGHQHLEGARAFTLEETMRFAHQVCPGCGRRSEWWTWYRHQDERAWYLSVGRCPECDRAPGPLSAAEREQP